MVKQKNTLVFTFKESMAIRRMLNDLNGHDPLCGKSIFGNQLFMEKTLFKKLALLDLDKQKVEVNFIDVNFNQLKEAADDGSISATLFNLYADDELKKDPVFANCLVEIDGQNLFRFDFADEIRKNEEIEQNAFYHDSSFDGKVFQYSSKNLQNNPSFAFLWVSKLYHNYKKAGFDPYIQVNDSIFNQENTLLSIDKEVIHGWLEDEEFRNNLALIDSRFQTKENSDMSFLPNRKSKILVHSHA